MPMTDKQAETLRIFYECGENKRETARRMGKSEGTVRQALKIAMKWKNAESGHKAAIETTGLSIEKAKFGWRIIQHEDGSRDSVFWDERDKEEVNIDELTESITDAFSDIQKAKPVKVKFIGHDTTCVFPVADLHIGLLTHAEEVGVEWNTKTAMKVFEETFGKLIGRTPSADVAILGQLGDLTHNDDQRNVTPQSGHQLDVDGRFHRVLTQAVTVMKWAIDALRDKYPRVIYRGCRGNHDMTTHIAVTLALSEHYRNCPEVEIITSASEFYVHEFGDNMFLFHHGDKAKPDRLVSFIASEFPEVWGRTKHRVTFSGHVHHEWVKYVAGMMFRSVGTIIPRDVHAFSNAFGSARCLTSYTYDKRGGQVASARVNL